MAWDGIVYIDGNEKKLCKNSSDKFNSSSNCSNKPNLKEKSMPKQFLTKRKSNWNHWSAWKQCPDVNVWFRWEPQKVEFQIFLYYSSKSFVYLSPVEGPPVSLCFTNRWISHAHDFPENTQWLMLTLPECCGLVGYPQDCLVTSTPTCCMEYLPRAHYKFLKSVYFRCTKYCNCVI